MSIFNIDVDCTSTINYKTYNILKQYKGLTYKSFTLAFSRHITTGITLNPDLEEITIPFNFLYNFNEYDFGNESFKEVFSESALIGNSNYIIIPIPKLEHIGKLSIMYGNINQNVYFMKPVPYIHIKISRTICVSVPITIHNLKSIRYFDYGDKIINGVNT